MEHEPMAVGGFVYEPSNFDVGDWVVALGDIGGVLTPRVRKGSAGVVTSRIPDGRLAVRFEYGRTETVDRKRVAATASFEAREARGRRRWFRR
jgi:hypothetical protein